MRQVLLALLLTATLAGCATVRSGLAEYQAAADKGIGANLGGPIAEPAATPSSEGRAQLPGGLGGDKANASYTGTPQ